MREDNLEDEGLEDQDDQDDQDNEEPEPEKKVKVFQGTVNGKPYKGAKLKGMIKAHCLKCHHDFEQNLSSAGEIVKCPKCQNEGMGE